MAGLAKLRSRDYHRPPLSKPIGDDLFELTHVGKLNTRVLYFFMKGRRIILLHGIMKKTRALPIRERKVALERLFKGSVAGNIVDEMASHCWKLHKAPLPWEYRWELNFEERAEYVLERDVYYIRVRQTNDQWAWSSPIFVGHT